MAKKKKQPKVHSETRQWDKQTAIIPLSDKEKKNKKTKLQQPVLCILA